MVCSMVAGLCYTADTCEVSADGTRADIVLQSGLEDVGDIVTAVATQDSRKAWKHKHLPFCLTGIHIRRSTVLQEPPDL